MGGDISQIDKEVKCDPLTANEQYFGLANFGNTCYCNSVLQALHFCRPFRAKILEYKLSHKNVPPNEETLLTCLSDLYQCIATQKKKTGTVSPKRFVARLRREKAIFNNYNQHDAHEFFNYLLNTIADLLTAEKKASGDADTGDSSCSKKQANKTWISDIFQGTLTNVTRCLMCESLSSKDEDFLDLSVEIQTNPTKSIQPYQEYNVNLTLTSLYNIYNLFWSILDWFLSWILGPPITLEDCLQAFFSLDELKGEDMYNCDKCKELRNGVKLLSISSLPDILCIHLKRFRHDLPYPQKITRHVSFPLNGLDMMPYLSEEKPSDLSASIESENSNTIKALPTDDNLFSNSLSSSRSSLSSPDSTQSADTPSKSKCLYDLVAVICHTGTYASGHYKTYALNDQSQTWYEFDDQYVTPVDPQTIASCEAYILFYKKVNSI